MHQHLFWILSRAAGTAALLLSSVSVAVGLSMGGRLVKGRLPDLRAAHEALSLATLAALVVHALSLLGDSFLHPSLVDVTIPFASSYKEPWMAIGIVGGWMMVILGGSYSFRARIGVQRWRTLHRFTALAWILGVAHTLGEGTDAGSGWYLLLCATCVLPAAALLGARLSPSRPAVPATAPRA